MEHQQRVRQRQQNQRRQWQTNEVMSEEPKKVDLTKPIWLPNDPDPQGLRKCKDD
jgi:hypothetical protein